MESKKKSILYKVGALVILLAVAGVMFIVGRGHTLYFDNKTIEYNGKSYPALYKIEILKSGDEKSKLYEKERGMDTCIGQSYRMNVNITPEKGGQETSATYDIKLPYNMDGIIINLPAFLAGLPEEAYLSEFVSLPPEADENEEVVTDEFDMGSIE